MRPPPWRPRPPRRRTGRGSRSTGASGSAAGPRGNHWGQTVAAALVDGAVGTGHYEGDSFKRKDLLAMARKITHRVVPVKGAIMFSGGVKIRTRDGHEGIGFGYSKRAGGPGRSGGSSGPPGAAPTREERIRGVAFRAFALVTFIWPNK